MPLPGVQVKLQSVPEMKYLVSDRMHDGVKVLGRGEVLVKGWVVFVLNAFLIFLVGNIGESCIFSSLFFDFFWKKTSQKMRYGRCADALRKGVPVLRTRIYYCKVLFENLKRDLNLTKKNANLEKLWISFFL
jgi:hypothetical protein